MSFFVFKGTETHEVNEADAGKFLNFFFSGFESRPFKFKCSEAGLGAKNVISLPRVHTLTSGAKIAVHLNFFCSPSIKKFAFVDCGKPDKIKVVQDIQFKLTKLHLTARSESDQKSCGEGEASKTIADRSIHRAANEWDSRSKNLDALVDHLKPATTRTSLLADLETFGYGTGDFGDMVTMLQTSIIDQAYHKFSNPDLVVTFDVDKSAEFLE